MTTTKLFSSAIVLVTADIKRTTNYYNEVLGFEVVEHYELEEKFAACYRDEVEIVFVQSCQGKIKSNQTRYGAGYDAYLCSEDVDVFYEEVRKKGAEEIIEPPVMTTYGSYEFVIEDIEGRRIGVGRVRDKAKFFAE